MDNSIDILMVDDRPDGLLALEALLSEHENYRLVKAQSGLEALNLVSKYDFSVILMDVQMPELDGFQTAELIRKNIENSQIPIIFVTAINKDDRYVYRGYEAGAVDYIFKPFDPFILTSKVAVFADLHLQKRMVRLQAAELRGKERLQHRANLQSVEIENLRRYRNLANAIPHMVWRAAPDGSLEYYNELWCTYTGLSLEDSLGMGWQKAFNAYDLKNLLGIWMHSIQTGLDFEVECRVQRYDGVFRWHLIRAVAETNFENQIIAWLGTCTDIHDRKLVEKRLLEAQKNSDAANQAKTQFLANMSHEIRTPLSAIIGFTELTLDPQMDDADRMSNLSIVRRNSHQLLKIIDEILDISKVEAGHLEMEKVDTDMVDLLSGLRSLLHVSAANKGVKLQFKLRDKIPDRVLTDATRLRQILMNVIGNAIKFTHQGQVTVTASYSMKSSGQSYLGFRIQDTGIGLNNEMAEKLFTPFVQADCSTTRLYGGTGLGLALARQLARALGGDVYLEYSELCLGSIFSIEVEAEPLGASSWVKELTAFSPGGHVIPIKNSSTELAGAKILLVEDAEDNQILISHFLRKSGAEIDLACNGKEGMEKALANDYSVVLMDIQMPLLDGYEATSRLRQAGYDRPIIALTAHALKEERELALRTGCNGHLTKPIDRRELINSLKKYLPVPEPAAQI